MTRQHFKAFAEEVREWRIIAKKQEETSNFRLGEQAYSMALGIENAVIKIGKRFNPEFSEEKFRHACNPE